MASANSPNTPRALHPQGSLSRHSGGTLTTRSHGQKFSVRFKDRNYFNYSWLKSQFISTLSSCPVHLLLGEMAVKDR